MKTVQSSLSQFEKSKEQEQKLMHDFLETLENPEMKEMVEKISLPYEILSQYTSLLEESLCEYNHCKNCKGLLECKNQISGFAYLPHAKQDHLEFEYQACRYKRKQQEKESHLRYITCFDTPRQVRDASMKQIYTDDENRFEALKTINQFLKTYPKKSKGIYIYGSFGSGKTYLISAMLNELAKREVRSAIVFWPEFLRDLKGSMNEKDVFQRKFEAVKKVPILFIDDIGAENTTAWGRDEIFGPILQYRMQEELPTFFTSNLDLKALEQHFSISKDGAEVIKARRIIERIKQMTTYVEMVSQNLRG